MKITLRPLLAIASDVSSTSSIGVLDNSTRGTISPTLSLRLLGTCPLISNFLLRSELAMSERTLVCLRTLSLGELKARSGTRRRNTRGRIVILTLTVALGVRVTLALPLAFTFDIGMGKSGNVSSRNSGRGICRGRPLSIRVMPVVTLGSFLATTLVHPLGNAADSGLPEQQQRPFQRA